MSKARWIELENVLVVDFRPKYRSKLLIPSRTVYRRRSRGIVRRGAVLTPQDVGRISAVFAGYQKESLWPYMRSLAVFPLPDGVTAGVEPLSGIR